MNGHKLYLSACMDLYNGEIITHSMARRPVFELVSSMLVAALPRLESAQYKMQLYRAKLVNHSVPQSVSRKGELL